MTTSTKSQILAMLTEQPRPLSVILEHFTEVPQRRGAASVLAYLRTSGEIAEDTAGNLYLTGAAPQKPARKKRTRAPEAEIGAELEVDAPPVVTDLQYALWHDDDLMIKRDDATIFITSAERAELLAWMHRRGLVEAA